MIRLKISVLFVAVFFAVSVASADSATPFATLNVSYNGAKVNSTFYAMLLHCLNTSGSNYPSSFPKQLNISVYNSSGKCYWTYPSLPYGWPQRCPYNASYNACTLANAYYPNFRVVVYLPGPNKTFITSSAKIHGVANYYNIQLFSNGTSKIYDVTSIPLLQQRTIAILQSMIVFFVIALIVTLAVDLTVAAIFLKTKALPPHILVAVVIATVISLPIVWFGIALTGNILLVILFSELFAILFDGYFIFYLNKKIITLKDSLILSLAMNIASFIIGGLIYLYFAIY